MRTGKAIAQHHLRDPKPVNDSHRHLIASSLALGERTAGEIERDLRAHRLVGYEQIFARAGRQARNIRANIVVVTRRAIMAVPSLLLQLHISTNYKKCIRPARKH